ncbi:MAG: TauD/TfdA family dioxygenase, partial [Gammaproteobacteria bacterium]|nr:TauD/TfdA family dioxygenase [Gammaproteobacteria bacterium]
LFQCDALNALFGIHINTCGRDADIQGPVLFPLLDLMFEYGLVTVSESRSGNNHFDDYTLHITNVDESRTYNQQIRLDINFRPLPLIAAIMYCKSDSEDAARFVDTRAAYLALPRKLKRRIQGLRLRWQPCPEIRLDAVLDDGVTTANRNASHVVTGAQFLNLLIREKCSIVDLSDKEADSLLTSVCNHALQETFCYTHAHSDGDLITWNPRQILHVPSAGAKGMPKYIYPRTLSGTILGGIVES